MCYGYEVVYLAPKMLQHSSDEQKGISDHSASMIVEPSPDPYSWTTVKHDPLRS